MTWWHDRYQEAAIKNFHLPLPERTCDALRGLVEPVIRNQTAGWRSVIVVPISTSASQARRGPTAVAIAGGIAGLAKASVALCHQVTTLDRYKLTRRIGLLPLDVVEELDADCHR